MLQLRNWNRRSVKWEVPAWHLHSPLPWYMLAEVPARQSMPVQFGYHCAPSRPTLAAAYLHELPEVAQTAINTGLEL